MVAKNSGLHVLTNKDFTNYGLTSAIPEHSTCQSISKHFWWRLLLLSRYQCAPPHFLDSVVRWSHVTGAGPWLWEHWNEQPMWDTPYLWLYAPFDCTLSDEVRECQIALWLHSGQLPWTAVSTVRNLYESETNLSCVKTTPGQFCYMVLGIVPWSLASRLFPWIMKIL